MAARLTRAPDLQIHPVPNGYVVRRAATGAVHHLNAAAALLLELCQGDAAADVPAVVARATGLPAAEIQLALDDLVRTGLVIRETAPASSAPLGDEPRGRVARSATRSTRQAVPAARRRAPAGGRSRSRR